MIVIEPFGVFFFFFFKVSDLTLFVFANFVQLYHPSALNLFDQIVCESKGKQIVTFLDYDGTLSPIVADPDKAYMSQKVHLLFSLVLFTNFKLLK